jgi:uncharacterized protein (TIGR03086 family)
LTCSQTRRDVDPDTISGDASASRITEPPTGTKWPAEAAAVGWSEHRAKPTPCSEFSCHELVEHLFGSLVRLRAMAGALVKDPQVGSLENRISVMAAQLIDAWRGLDLDGVIHGPGGNDMPASFAASILPLELVLHGCDLAQGSGQQIHISDQLVDYLQGLAENIVPPARQGGSFAEAVPPVQDASALDRLAAFAGRTPLAA